MRETALHTSKRRVAVLLDDFSYVSAPFIDRLIESLRERVDLTIVNGLELPQLLGLQPCEIDVIVLPDARFLPAAAKDSLLGFLKRGGNLLAIGGATFSSGDFEPPILETLSPAYKTFELNDAARLEPYRRQVIFGQEAASADPGKLICPIWRPRGLGAQKDNDYRWIPLVSAFDESGEFRGTPASVMVNVGNEFAGSIWGHIGTCDQRFLEDNGDYVIGLAEKLLERMDSGAFLAAAGTEHFCYLTDETIEVGVRFAKHGRGRATEAELIIRRGDDIYFSRSWELRDDTEELTEELPVSLPAGRYRVKTSLLAYEEVIDCISYEFSVVDANRKLGPDLVTIKDGDFYLRGRKWYPIGINFWPLYCSAHEPYEYHQLSWQSPIQYDPEWIDLDLDQLASLGMNSVSIQFPEERCVRPVMDFLERCRERDIKVNVSVNGHAIKGHPEFAAKLIQATRMAENDTVYTYDLAWEPHFGPEKDREALDPRWRRWLEDRYGGVENAEKDWDFKTTQADGSVAGPTDEQLVNDGPWNTMVAAYRRFADDIISKGYGRSVRVIREADPNHLFGVRTGYGGTGQPGIAHHMPYDLISGIKHLDYTSPEGYGLGGDYVNYRRAGLLNIYGRFVSNGRPVFWSEYGVPHYYQGNTWDHSQENQTQYFADMHRMFLETDVSGGAGWWWPGGHRVDEDSDFGIINPDRSPRPAALEIKKVIDDYKKTPPARSPADYWIEIDRDLHANGLPSLWLNNADEYMRALDEGKSVGLKTKGTGTDSSNTPMVAVGNTPINGHNPPKYLNAEFNWLRILDASGEWVEVEDGDTIEVRPSVVRIRASVGNIAEAAWLTPVEACENNGGVYLCAGCGETILTRTPLPSRTPYLADAEFPEFELPGVRKETEIALWMIAENRSPFGEKLRFKLCPKEEI